MNIILIPISNNTVNLSSFPASRDNFNCVNSFPYSKDSIEYVFLSNSTNEDIYNFRTIPSDSLASINFLNFSIKAFHTGAPAISKIRAFYKFGLNSYYSDWVDTSTVSTTYNFKFNYEKENNIFWNFSNLNSFDFGISITNNDALTETRISQFYIIVNSNINSKLISNYINNNVIFKNEAVSFLMKESSNRSLLDTGLVLSLLILKPDGTTLTYNGSPLLNGDNFFVSIPKNVLSVTGKYKYKYVISGNVNYESKDYFFNVKDTWQYI